MNLELISQTVKSFAGNCSFTKTTNREGERVIVFSKWQDMFPPGCHTMLREMMVDAGIDVEKLRIEPTAIERNFDENGARHTSERIVEDHEHCNLLRIIISKDPHPEMAPDWLMKHIRKWNADGSCFDGLHEVAYGNGHRKCESKLYIPGERVMPYYSTNWNKPLPKNAYYFVTSYRSPADMGMFRLVKLFHGSERFRLSSTSSIAKWSEINK